MCVWFVSGSCLVEGARLEQGIALRLRVVIVLANLVVLRNRVPCIVGHAMNRRYMAVTCKLCMSSSEFVFDTFVNRAVRCLFYAWTTRRSLSCIYLWTSISSGKHLEVLLTALPFRATTTTAKFLYSDTVPALSSAFCFVSASDLAPLLAVVGFGEYMPMHILPGYQL